MPGNCGHHKKTLIKGRRDLQALLQKLGEHLKKVPPEKVRMPRRCQPRRRTS